MRKIIALLLSGAIMLTGCSKQNSVNTTYTSQSVVSEITVAETTQYETTTVEIIDNITTESAETDKISGAVSNTEYKYTETVPEFTDLNDPNLLRYYEDSVYSQLVNTINSNDYFIENVSAVYISKEYLEELEYNSQVNIFFGYTLAEVEEQFQGKKYVFTLSENGETTVREFEEYDDTYEKVIKNVAIGTGVILLCVTVSVVTGGAGLPAVSMIFAASAKSAAVFALSSGAISGAAAGIVTGVQTQNFDEALKSAALAGSESFKWGAITGAVSGGASEAIALKGATLNGLTMNEAAAIQKESKYPLDVIKQFKNMDQYNICKDAGLKVYMLDGKATLLPEFDVNYVDEFGRTNIERMRKGLAALDPATGKSFELHHIGQKADSTLAALTKEQHMTGGNNAIWHEFGVESKVHGTSELDSLWNTQRENVWKSIAMLLGG